jgi:hypothetical protein
MEKEIDIFEYEWWKVFVGYSLLLGCSILLIGFGCFGSQMIDYPITSYKDLALFRLYWLSIVGIAGLFISVIGLLSIRSVPKLIKFKSDSMNVVYPMGQEKIFLYENINRILIKGDVTRRSQWAVSSLFPFRVRIYLFNNTVKIMFNPDRLVNFPTVLDGFKKSGLGSIIEHKYYSSIAG